MYNYLNQFDNLTVFMGLSSPVKIRRNVMGNCVSIGNEVVSSREGTLL